MNFLQYLYNRANERVIFIKQRIEIEIYMFHKIMDENLNM